MTQRSGLLGLTPAQRVGGRIVRAIVRSEREVFISRKDRLLVLGATASPSLWAWGLTRLRRWRAAEKRRWLHSGALLLGTLALDVAAGAALLKRLVDGV